MLVEKTFRYTCRLPRIGHHVRQPPDKIIKAQSFAGVNRFIGDVSSALNVNRGNDLPRGVFVIRIHGLARVDLVPAHGAQDVAVVINRTPAPPLFVQHLRKKNFQFTVSPAPPDGYRFRRVSRTVRVNGITQPRQSLVLQPGFHALNRLAHVLVVTIDVALVQGAMSLNSSGVRLPHDPPHHLRHGRRGRGVVQQGQHVGKRAIPALFECIFGENPADGTLLAQYIFACEFLALGRLNSYPRLRYGKIAYQVFAHVFGMNVSPAPLLLARPLYPDQRDGTNVAIFA